MEFTKYHSLKDILDYPGMPQYLKIFYSDFLMEMFPENRMEDPLALTEHFGKTPWEEPFSVIVDQLLDAANLVLDITENRKRVCVPLWNQEKGAWTLRENREGEEKEEEKAEGKREEKADEKGERDGKEQVFLVAPSPCKGGFFGNGLCEGAQEKRQQKNEQRKKAVILCPGGGYEAVCFSGEGTPVLKLLEARGYVGFILKYQVAPSRYPEPQKDLALAVMYVRLHAQEYGIDPGDILVLGASAGGHLSASEAALHEELAAAVCADLKPRSPELAEAYKGVSARPDLLCLCYPVISFLQEPHEGSFQNLTGGKEALRKMLSVEELVTGDFPKTYVWTCGDDTCVPPSNASLLARTLEEKQVPHMLHMFPGGGHGCGLAFTKSAYPWSKEMLAFLGQ